MPRAGMTKKPCQGCGAPGPRPTDSVCRRCCDLIAEGQRARERQPDTDLQPFWYHSRHWAGPTFYGGTGIRGEEQRALQEAIYDLVNLVSEPDQTQIHRSDGERLFQRDYDRRDWPIAVWMRPEVAHALRRLDGAVLDGLRVAHANGLREGSSVLEGLARGSLSLDDFNAKVTR